MPEAPLREEEAVTLHAATLLLVPAGDKAVEGRRHTWLQTPEVTWAALSPSGRPWQLPTWFLPRSFLPHKVQDWPLGTQCRFQASE